VLEAYGYPTDGYRSKDWDEFAAQGAPVMDFILTVCDGAAGEACPVWPGRAAIPHWDIEDPAEGSDAEKEQDFVLAFEFLKSRIGTFVHLPLATLDQFTIGTRLQAIGHVQGASIVPASGAAPHPT
jgi:arsenate reductase